MRAHHQDADRIIITGDLTHWAEREAYEALREVLLQQTLPVRLMMNWFQSPCAEVDEALVAR